MKKQILQHVINGCQIEILNYKCDYVGIQYAKANGHYFIGKELYVTYDGGSTGKSVNEFKLILLGLDNLTKEIEVNGEKFIPMEIIGKTYEKTGIFKDGIFGWDTATGGDDFQDYYLIAKEDLTFEIYCGDPDDGGYCIETFNIHFDTIQKLLEWHFDIYGLIEKGLAIDKNTIK